MNKKAIILIIFSSLVLNAILFGFILKSTKSNTSETRSSLPYLSPRIFIEGQNDILINFVNLRTKLNAYEQSVSGEKIGIYFEYLPSGVSIGINDRESYVLASLLKVPLVMAVYKEYELGNLKRDQELTVQESNLDPFFGNLWKEGIGTKLTVDQAVKLSLVDSDNTAKSVLFDALTPGSLEMVFDYLDIPKELDSNSAVVTPKNYSSILRSLYLSSYLAPRHSNEILDILTRTKFHDKLPAGVDVGVKVAHKIGVYQPQDNNKSMYTDCGIVFLPKRPYILCLMQRAPENEVRKNMSEISKIVFDYVSKAK